MTDTATIAPGLHRVMTLLAEYDQQRARGEGARDAVSALAGDAWRIGADMLEESDSYTAEAILVRVLDEVDDGDPQDKVELLAAIDAAR